MNAQAYQVGLAKRRTRHLTGGLILSDSVHQPRFLSAIMFRREGPSHEMFRPKRHTALWKHRRELDRRVRAMTRASQMDFAAARRVLRRVGIELR